MQTKIYKSDDAIAKEFKGFHIVEITTNAPTGSAAVSGYITIQWPNAGDHVGGGVENGDETTDSWIDYNGDGQKIAFDSWYPNETYHRLTDAIRYSRGLQPTE